MADVFWPRGTHKDRLVMLPWMVRMLKWEGFLIRDAGFFLRRLWVDKHDVKEGVVLLRWLSNLVTGY